MPKIAQYEPNQVQSQVVAQPRAQNAPTGAFGGDVARGIGDVVQAGFEMKTRIDTTSAEEAIVQFEREKNDVFFNPDSGYFNTQGRNAYDNAGVTSKALDDLKKRHGETLNAESKLMFDRSADVHITRSQTDIARHASKGLKAWEVSTIEAQVENSLENASLYWNEPDRLKVQNVLGRQAIIDSSQLMGISPEATAEKLQTFESSFANSTIASATLSSAADGQIAMDDYGDRLEGPDKVKLTAAIEKKTKTEKTQADASAAILVANGLINRYDDKADIIEEVNKIEDADLKKKTMAEAMAQHSRRKSAESEFRASSFEEAEDEVYKTGSVEQYKAVNSEAWESLNEKQKRKLESGGVTDSDMNTYTDLILLPKAKLAKIDPNDYAHKLAKSERKSLANAVKVARNQGSAKEKIDHQAGRTRAAQTTEAVVQMFGKKSGWSKTKREQANRFYALLDGEEQYRKSQVDRELTSEEYTNLLSDFTRKAVQEGRFYGTNEFDLTDIPTTDKDGDPVMPQLSKVLRSNNVPVTTHSLFSLYNQLKEEGQL